MDCGLRVLGVKMKLVVCASHTCALVSHLADLARAVGDAADAATATTAPTGDTARRLRHAQLALYDAVRAAARLLQLWLQTAADEFLGPAFVKI